MEILNSLGVFLSLVFSKKMERLKKRNVKEKNFLYESSTILYDVCSDFLDVTFKFDPPKLLLTATKLCKDKKHKKKKFFV